MCTTSALNYITRDGRESPPVAVKKKNHGAKSWMGKVSPIFVAMSHAAPSEHAQFNPGRVRSEHLFPSATQAGGMLMNGGLSLAIYHRLSIPSRAENMLTLKVRHVTELFDGGGLGVFPPLRHHNDLLISPSTTSPDAGLLLGSSHGSSSERIGWTGFQTGS